MTIRITAPNRATRIVYDNDTKLGRVWKTRKKFKYASYIVSVNGPNWNANYAGFVRNSPSYMCGSLQDGIDALVSAWVIVQLTK